MNSRPATFDRRRSSDHRSDDRPASSSAPHRVAVLETSYNRRWKPVVDRVLAGVLLVVLAPVVAAIALAIRATLGGQVLFRQRRVGLGGREFEILKFRTMRPCRRVAQQPFEGGVDRRATHKSDDDPRHTPLGRFLRRWSLDELPQLVNVLRGEMSLVGPRPELTEVAAGYPVHLQARHSVRPGITGLWQVTRRGEGLLAETAEIDLTYVEQQSLLVDLGILLRTPGAAMGLRRGS